MYKNGKYYAHKFIINGEQKMFYSREKTEAAAWLDIYAQKASFEEQIHKQKHNFKMLADKMIEVNYTKHSNETNYILLNQELFENTNQDHLR